MHDRDEKIEMDLRGHLEVSDELCDDGNQALVIVTSDGDEYYIKNKKKIRRLQKYAFYEDIEIDFHGILKYDLDGLPVFSIISYTPPKNNAVEKDESTYKSVSSKTSRRKRKVEDDDDEETEGIDEVIEIPEDADEYEDNNDDFDDAAYEDDDGDDEDDEDDDGSK